jgi:hypothetical protein
VAALVRSTLSASHRPKTPRVALPGHQRRSLTRKSPVRDAGPATCGPRPVRRGKPSSRFASRRQPPWIISENWWTRNSARLNRVARFLRRVRAIRRLPHISAIPCLATRTWRDRRDIERDAARAIACCR